MIGIQRVFILLGVIALVILVVFPPYAAIRLPREDNVHGFIGYHPIWSPPTAEQAHAVLAGEKYDPSSDIDLSRYVVMFNKVRFIFNLLVLFIVFSALQIVLRRISRRRLRPDH